MKYRNVFARNALAATVVLLAGGIIAGYFIPTKSDDVENLIYTDIHNKIQNLRPGQDLTHMKAFYSKYPLALDRYITEHVADSTAYADDLHVAVRAFVKDNPDMSSRQILNKINNVTYSNDALDRYDNNITNLRCQRDIVRDISISLDMARRVKSEIQR